MLYLGWELIPVPLRLRIVRVLCDLQLDHNPDFLKVRYVVEDTFLEVPLLI